jgi:hypothetical protein
MCVRLLGLVIGKCVAIEDAERVRMEQLYQQQVLADQSRILQTRQMKREREPEHEHGMCIGM